MTTNDSKKSVLIFHRSENNSEEDLLHQKAFLEANKEALTSAKVIDYVTGDGYKANEVFAFTQPSQKLPIKVSVIVNSFLSKRGNSQQYDLYSYFKVLQAVGMVSMYLMDEEGKLYKEIERIDI